MLRKWRFGAGLSFLFGLILAIVGTLSFALTGALAEDSGSKFDTTGAHTLTWTGQGGGSDFQTQCTGDTAAPGTLLWILTTGGGTAADKPVLTINGTAQSEPTNHGGSWHFLTSWFTTTTPPTTAVASFNVTDTGNGTWNLVISHGCPGTPPAETTTLSTTVYDAATEHPLVDLKLANQGSAYDKATLNYTGAGTPTGSIAYKFWTNGDCGVSEDKSGTDAGTTSIGSGSDVMGPLDPGSYSFKAWYTSGDTTKFLSSVSDCEPFTVTAPPSGKTDTTITTKVFDETADEEVAVDGTIVGLNHVVHDTATVGTQVGENVIGGTVTYYFFNTNTCPTDGKTGALNSSAKEMSGGTVPDSSSQEPLAAGSYAYDAVYSGDGDHYNGSISACETFKVEAPNPRGVKVDTVVFDAKTNAAVKGIEKQGDSFYDTSTVTPLVGTATPTGKISYTFWTNQACSGTGTAAGTDLALGSHSTTQGPLNTAGWYSFKAHYSGDTNYDAADSVCEPFDVDPMGAVLAATGMNTPAQGFAIVLMAFGLVAMTAGFVAWRRREA